MLRNQSCGTRWRSAGSGPRFSAVITAWTSSASALAYSTVTSKNRSPSKTPVSSISYSGCSRPRRPFASTRSA
ncbi:hypothetical protein MOR12E_12340 [Methylobacterium oryzae]